MEEFDSKVDVQSHLCQVMHVQPPLQRKQVSQTHVHSSQQQHHHPRQHDHHRHRYNVVAPHNVDYSYSYSWSHALPVEVAQTSLAPATPVLAVPRATSAITLPTRHHPRHTGRHTSRTTGGGAGGGAGASGAPGAGAHLVVVSMSRQKHSTNATARSKSRRKLASLCRRRKHEENASTKVHTCWTLLSSFCCVCRHCTLTLARFPHKLTGASIRARPLCATKCQQVGASTTRADIDASTTTGEGDNSTRSSSHHAALTHTAPSARLQPLQCSVCGEAMWVGAQRQSAQRRWLRL